MIKLSPFNPDIVDDLKRKLGSRGVLEAIWLEGTVTWGA